MCRRYAVATPDEVDGVQRLRSVELIGPPGLVQLDGAGAALSDPLDLVQVGGDVDELVIRVLVHVGDGGRALSGAHDCVTDFYHIDLLCVIFVQYHQKLICAFEFGDPKASRAILKPLSANGFRGRF